MMEKAGMSSCLVVLLLLLLLKLAGKGLENRWNVVEGFIAIASSIGFFLAVIVTLLRGGNTTWADERPGIFFGLGCLLEALVILVAVSLPFVSLAFSGS